MTSRERVRRALNYQDTDRTPIDVGGTMMTGVHVDAYCEIVRHLGLDLMPPKCYEQYQMLARVEEPMMRFFHSDVIQLENPIVNWGFNNDHWRLWKTHLDNEILMPGAFTPDRDERGYLHIRDVYGNSLAYMSPGSLYFEKNCPTGLSDDFTLVDPDTWRRSLPLYTDEELDLLQQRGRFLKDNTDYSVHGGCVRGQLGTHGLYAGHTISDWLCLLTLEPAYTKEILEAAADRAIENLSLYLEAAGSCIDTILVSGADYGTQRNELFSPEIFREQYMPAFKRINDFIHRHTEAKTMIHSCGSLYGIIESLIEGGFDILNPVHTNAHMMKPELLTERFGGRIVFWGGGVETQTTLPYGTPEEVYEQVQARIRVFGETNGFVFAAVHNIQYGVPFANIQSMIRAVLEYRS
ncbi:MAG: hypothetical protein FWF86_04210 [Clostridia bacterium]|nr:hypothetical protein [Clostridia bacterium]